LRETHCREGRKCPNAGESVIFIRRKTKGVELLDDFPVTRENFAARLSAFDRATYVVWVDEQDTHVGLYDGGGAATRLDWKASVLNLKARRVTASSTLIGENPPPRITVTGPAEGRSGPPPRDKLDAWLRTLPAL
jgi:hypothetical protein